MDAIISDAVRRGQHLYHIAQTNSLGVSKSTVYRHLHRGYLSVAKIDFPRVVKFKPRKQKQGEYIPKALKIGRTYADFCAYIAENAIPSWVEMDTVIGRIGGKVILTLYCYSTGHSNSVPSFCPPPVSPSLSVAPPATASFALLGREQKSSHSFLNLPWDNSIHFTFCNFMFGILLDNKTAADTARKINALKLRLCRAGFSFGALFPLLLTDNGGEFADVFSIENNAAGERESFLFFCDPMQSCQKPRVEKNHTLFRDIVPKGESFDGFSQDTVNLIFSHMNSVKRSSLCGKSSYDVFAFTFGQSLPQLLGIQEIPADQVVQSPLLLKR
jgi:IS30 family transposase